MRWVSGIVFAVGLLGLSTPTSAMPQSDGGSAQGGTPLDLPAGSASRSEDEEEETETINFYGSNFEGDAFFWCLDRSGSMWGAQLSVLKSEVTGAISQLSNRAEFGIVQFDDSFESWRPTPTTAAPPQKVEAEGWVNALTAGGLTCIAQAVVETLGIANQSRKRHRQVILVGDGIPSCAENTLADISAANYERITINTLFIGASTSGQALFQSIALENAGTFSIADGG